MRNIDRIDAVMTENPFRCSGCRENKEPGLVRAPGEHEARPPARGGIVELVSAAR